MVLLFQTQYVYVIYSVSKNMIVLQFLVNPENGWAFDDRTFCESLPHSMLILSIFLQCLVSLVYLLFDDLYVLINYMGFVNWLAIGISVFILIYLRIKKPEWDRPIKVSLLDHYLTKLFCYSIIKYCIPYGIQFVKFPKRNQIRWRWSNFWSSLLTGIFTTLFGNDCKSLNHLCCCRNIIST